MMKKLTKDEVLEILADTRSNRELGRVYKVSHETIGKIKRRQMWKDVGCAVCVAQSLGNVATLNILK
jgi:hypothetical protein